MILSSSRENLFLLLPGDEGQIALILPEIELIQSHALVFVRNGIFLIIPLLLIPSLGISTENLGTIRSSPSLAISKLQFLSLQHCEIAEGLLNYQICIWHFLLNFNFCSCTITNQQMTQEKSSIKYGTKFVVLSFSGKSLITMVALLSK